MFFPLSELNLHAASIWQSIVLNRLQCVLLSVPLSLYMTGCGSVVALSHIQVSVHVDACCCGVVPTALNVKETNLSRRPLLNVKAVCVQCSEVEFFEMNEKFLFSTKSVEFSLALESLDDVFRKFLAFSKDFLEYFFFDQL